MSLLVTLPLLLVVSMAFHFREPWCDDERRQGRTHPEIVCASWMDPTKWDNRDRFVVTMEKVRAAHREARSEVEPIKDAQVCPSACLARQADSVCDPQCNIPACLNDLGDCPSAVECNANNCPADGVCRWACELAGCNRDKEVCPLDDGFKQFVLIEFQVSPSYFYQRSKNLEIQMEKNYGGLKIRVQANSTHPMLWGFRNGRVQQLTFEDLREETSGWEDHSLILMSLHRPFPSGLVTAKDEKTMAAIQRLGGVNNVMRADARLMVLSDEQTADFSEKYVEAAGINRLHGTVRRVPVHHV